MSIPEAVMTAWHEHKAGLVEEMRLRDEIGRALQRILIENPEEEAREGVIQQILEMQNRAGALKLQSRHALRDAARKCGIEKVAFLDLSFYDGKSCGFVLFLPDGTTGVWTEEFEKMSAVPTRPHCGAEETSCPKRLITFG